MDKKQAARELREQKGGQDGWSLVANKLIDTVSDLLDPPIAPPVKVPDGYEWRDKEYRLPKKGEWCISLNNGTVYQAGHDYVEQQHYIIYKIEPKFKPGDVLVTASGAIWLMSSEGVRWLDGDLYDGHPDCVMATTTQINEYLRGNPRQAVKAVQTLAKFYAEEAKQ